MPDPTEQDLTATPEPTIEHTPEAVKPSASPTSGVRNPDKLLELYNQQKEELKSLKDFKAGKEAESSQAEQERLKKEQQYEALIPVKIKEATDPLSKQLDKLTKERGEWETKYKESNTQYEALQTTLKTDNLKDEVYQGFLSQGGDSKTTSKDTLWKLYGGDITVDEKGGAKDLEAMFTTMKADSFGQKLFVAVAPEGTGTPQQSTSTPKTQKGNSPVVVVTKAMLLNPKRHGITPEKLISGEMVVEG